MIDPLLLPPRVGDKEERTLLHAIFHSEGPSAIFVYGSRNVGKTAVLRYLSDLYGATYLDASEEEPEEKDLFGLLSEDRVLLLDEITYVITKRGRVGELDYYSTRSFFRRFLSVVEHRKARVIFTASYSIDVEAVHRELVRYYAKGLRRPRSASGRPQPYRIYALPRPLSSVIRYLEGINVKPPVESFISHIIPDELLDFTVGARPEEYLLWYEKLDKEALERGREAFMSTGGFPASLKAFKNGEQIDEERYLADELEATFGYKKGLKKLAPYFSGGGGALYDPSDIKELLFTFLAIPVQYFGLEEALSGGLPEYLFKLSKKVCPVPMGPKAARAILRFLKREPGEKFEALESAVLLHALYLQARSSESYRESLRPPVYRLPRIDFAFPVRIGHYSVPMLIEVKSSLAAVNLEEIAGIGYALGVYPIVVSRVPEGIRRVPVSISKIPERYREAHAINFERNYGSKTPYMDAKVRKVNLMDFKYFAMSAS